MVLYKKTHDLVDQMEEKALQQVLEDLYEKFDITEATFQGSLHYFCQDEKKLAKIRAVSEHAQNTINLIRPINKTQFQEYEDCELTTRGTLRIQGLLHKISIIEVKALTEIESQEDLYEEYMYLKPRIQDHFFLQTGVEIEEFNANLLHLGIEKHPEYVAMLNDYESAMRTLY